MTTLRVAANTAAAQLVTTALPPAAAGATRCLGAAVARMQAQVVLTELLTRCPDFEVDEAGIAWADSSHVRRPLSVPFRVRS